MNNSELQVWVMDYVGRITVSGSKDFTKLPSEVKELILIIKFPVS